MSAPIEHQTAEATTLGLPSHTVQPSTPAEAVEAHSSAVGHSTPAETVDATSSTVGQTPVEKAELAHTSTAPAHPVEENVTETAPTGISNATPADTATEVRDEKNSASPVSSGVLGYKAPGLIKHLKFSKRYFWLGQEPLSTQQLSHYLRGTEPKIAHPVAAWSTQTGKGLLYLVKTESEKTHPQDIIHLIHATDLQKTAQHEFLFKVHGEKHTFKATSDTERDGWYVAIEQAIAEANGSKASILKSDGYKESISHLGKPAALAGGVAAVKATEDKKEIKSEHKADVASEPAVTHRAMRANSSSSSSSSDVEKAAKKAEKKKSRSASGKRSSIFGSLLAKKDEHDGKKEVKKENKLEKKVEKEEEKKAEHNHFGEDVAVGAAGVGGVAAVDAAVEHHGDSSKISPEEKIVDTTPAAITAEPVLENQERPTVVTKSKRNSIFGSFYQKVKSPTQEKKELDFGPAVPPKDETHGLSDSTDLADTAPVALGTSAVHDTPAATTATGAASTGESSIPSDAHESSHLAAASIPAAVIEEKKDQTKETKPQPLWRENSSFLGGLMNKARAKSPAANKRDVKSADKSLSGPAVPPKDESDINATALADAPSADATTHETAIPVTSTNTTGASDSVHGTAAPGTTTSALETPAMLEGDAVADHKPVTSSATENHIIESATTGDKVSTPADGRRKSFFGNFGNSNKKEGSATTTSEKQEKPLFRKLSQAVRGFPGQHDKVEKRDLQKENTLPETVTNGAKSEASPLTHASDVEKQAVETEHPHSTGDVVAESISAGEPKTSNPTVSATA